MGGALGHIRGGCPGALVVYQFHRGDEAGTAYFTHPLVFTQRREPALQVFTHCRRVVVQLVTLIDFERLQRSGAGHGVTRVGITVTEYAYLRTGLPHRLIYVAAYYRGADGVVGRGQLLGKRHLVRLADVHGFAAEQFAGATEAGDDLVGPEQDVVLVQDGLHLFVVTRRRHDHTAGPGDGLGDKGGDGLGTLRQDQLFQVAGNALNKGRLGLIFLCPAVVVRVVGAQDAQRRQRGVEVGQVGGQAGQRARGYCHTVVGALAGDDLVFLRFSDHVKVIAQQLDVGVIGIGTRVAEKDLCIAHRHHGGQLVCQIDTGLMGLAAEHVGKRQLRQLPGDAFDELAVAVTKACAPQSGHTLEILFALVVVYVNAFTAFDKQLLGSHQVGGGVNHC